MTASSRRVLVTAVGGDLGQATVKALRLDAERWEIHGCDLESTGIAPAFVDSFHRVPRASDVAAYISALDETCARNDIVAVIPSNEGEIRVLASLVSNRSPALPSGARVVCHSGSMVALLFDKLECMRRVSDHVELAPFADGTDRGAVMNLVQDVGYPIVVKPRRLSGSRGIQVVQGERGLSSAIASMPDPLVQSFIDGESEEYSVGVYVQGEAAHSIALRRTLGPVGCSWYAEVSEAPDVDRYAIAVAMGLGVQGSVNVQVRRSSEGVRLLEVNGRLSSLVAARAAAGFRDAEWWLHRTLGDEVSPSQGPYARLRFQRYFAELIDRGRGFETPPEWVPGAKHTLLS